MSNDLYSIGLEERDRVNPSLGGGIPKSSIVLLEGEHGSGKSVITQRFCYGLCEEGHQVTYVSAEETASGFINQMGSLNYNVAGHMLSEQMLFLHADVDTRDTFDGQEDHRELLNRLMRASVMWRSDVVIIDGFDEILLNDPHYDNIAEQGDADDVMQNLITFFRRLTADGTTIVLTANPTSLSTQALRPLRNVSDVYIDIEQKTVESEVRKKMIVRKFAGMGEQVDDNIGFAVQAGRGLTIVTRTVA